MKTLLIFALLAANVLADLTVDSINGVTSRCGTKSLEHKEREKMNQELDEFIERECNQKASPVDDRLCTNINERKSNPKRAVTAILVAHHVIYDPLQNDKGNIPQTTIDAQMTKLNSDYNGTDFQFETYTVTRTGNTDWFNEIGKGTTSSVQHEIDMTFALAVGLPYVVQIYWVEISGGILGFTYLPSQWEEDSPDHCIIMHYETVPGGNLSPYNEGRTLVHEMGHTLGLEHTFQNGCTSPGDSVADTNYVEEPNYGCPTSHFSCGTSDPVDNFMDYADDACMDNFTPGQMQRMLNQVSLYRPSLLDPENAPAPPISSGTYIGPHVLSLVLVIFYFLI